MRKKLDLSQLVPAETLDSFRKKAKNYPRLLEVIRREDFLNMLGPRRELILKQPGGKEWLERQLDFLQGLF